MADAVISTDQLTIVLVGNPNTGKTTLFNALTGLRQHVGNYPGVTVETKTGTAYLEGKPVGILDVPGTYSLSPRSPDEMVAVDILLGHRPEIARPNVVVCILDASNLERNLYLGTQVLELGLPVVFALNMTDVAANRGIKIDAEKLSQSLGAPVVPIQANAKRGVQQLLATAAAVAEQQPPTSRVQFPDVFHDKATELQEWLASHANANGDIAPYLVERALLDSGGQTEIRLSKRFGSELTQRLQQTREQLREAGCPIPAIEARSRYAWISQRIAGCVEKSPDKKVTLTDRIDKILLHRVGGVVVFLALMALVFQSIYAWAGPLMDFIDGLFASAGEVVGAWLPEGALQGLIVDGIIAGVGGVLVFLPQIVILFGFIAILEDCGYMARAAFLMDKLMARCGLSGKSFIPMLSSFACAIPGIMAARTIEDRRDRLTTILVAPLMSCSARLPVYVLLIGAFIPATTVWGVVSLQGLVLFAMYMIGLILAPLVALVLKKTVIGGEAPVFLMELPSYKMPSISTVLFRMYDRGFAFIRRAGTIILASAIVIWALQYYPRPAEVAERFEPQIAQLQQQQAETEEEQEALEEQIATLENRMAAAYQEQSILGRIGQAVEPAVKPLGWDWRIAMAAVASFPAREVVIAALGTIYSVGTEVDEESPTLREAMKAAKWPDGEPVFNIPVALSIMVFFALCCQCAATLAVIKRETNSYRWPIFTFVYMTSLAYIGALIVYQIGSRIGGT